jgi:hypothetical protein
VQKVLVHLRHYVCKQRCKCCYAQLSHAETL